MLVVLELPPEVVALDVIVELPLWVDEPDNPLVLDPELPPDVPDDVVELLPDTTPDVPLLNVPPVVVVVVEDVPIVELVPEDKEFELVDCEEPVFELAACEDPLFKFVVDCTVTVVWEVGWQV